MICVTWSHFVVGFGELMNTLGLIFKLSGVLGSYLILTSFLSYKCATRLR